MGTTGCHLPGVQRPGRAGADGQEVVQSHKNIPVPSEEHSRERHRWRELTSEGPGGQGSWGRGRPQTDVSILGDKEEGLGPLPPGSNLGPTSAGGLALPSPPPWMEALPEAEVTTSQLLLPYQRCPAQNL